MNEKKTSYGMDIELTSSKPDGFHKKLSLSPVLWRITWITGVSLLALLVIWGIAMTILYNVQRESSQVLIAQNEQLELDKLALQDENDELTNQNSIMSATITHKVEEDADRVQAEIQMFVPDGIPVNGSAVYLEKTDENEHPYLEFTTDLGTEIVACGSGIVTTSSKDPQWGYRITIDHQNGYSTSYHVRENPKFIEGSEVKKGDVLFAVTKNNRTLEYSVTKDGVYLNPVDVMEVFG